jgi:hypothetical protein
MFDDRGWKIMIRVLPVILNSRSSIFSASPRRCGLVYLNNIERKTPPAPRIAQSRQTSSIQTARLMKSDAPERMPVSSLAVTLAPTTTRSDGSFTLPRRLPVVWARISATEEEGNSNEQEERQS